MVYEDDAGITGYLKYTLKNKTELLVIEMFSASDAAYRGLWGHLGTRPDVEKITYQGPADDPVHHLLKIPLNSLAGNQGWVFNDLYTATSSIMLRVIDLAEALTTRFYPHNMMGNRILKITDPQLPQNENLINFRIVDGRPDIIAVEDDAPDLETDIATFSQIFSGFVFCGGGAAYGEVESE